MKRMFVLGMCLILCAGCSTMCTFGHSDKSSGIECRPMDAKMEPGMSAKEVEALVGAPSRRGIDVSYRGKTYDEAWIYEASPDMILYFQNGLLEAKDYQQ